jgi:putative DNA primase/helicase
MVRSWVNAGCKPHSGKALGSFEAWSRVIGGILEHIGMEGFLGNLSEFYEVADTEGAALRSFIDAWWDEHGRDRVGVAELFQIAVRVEGISLGQGNDNSQKAEFGRLLAKQRDRVIGEFTVKHAGKVHGSQKWTLVKSSDELL